MSAWLTGMTFPPPSWPGLARPSTTSFGRAANSWMPGPNPGMTGSKVAPDREELLASGLPQRLGVHVGEAGQRALDRVGDRGDGRLLVAMGAAARLGDDAVDHLEAHQVLRRDL